MHETAYVSPSIYISIFSCDCIDLPQQYSVASAAGIPTIPDAGRHLQGEYTMLLTCDSANLL